MKNILKKSIGWLLFPFLLAAYLALFRKNNIIIFSSSNPSIYNDNTRYLFEYLSKNDSYDSYWVTNSKEIKQYLIDRDLKYLSSSSYNVLNLIYSFSAVAIINPGTGYHNPLGVVRKATIKITTGHGVGPKTKKTIRETFKKNLQELLEYQMFDYVNYPSDNLCHNVGRKIFLHSKSQVINLGYPRCDILLNNKEVDGNYKKKELTKYI